MENESLVIALTIVSIVSCVALFVNWAGNRHNPGLLVLSIGFMATTFGVLMLTTQGSVTSIISVILANTLILGGHIPIVMGLAAFWNQEQSKLPLICGGLFVSTMGAISYFTLIDEQSVLRIRAYTKTCCSKAKSNYSALNRKPLAQQHLINRPQADSQHSIFLL
jgi:hypothetical protein